MPRKQVADLAGSRALSGLPVQGLGTAGATKGTAGHLCVEHRKVLSLGTPRLGITGNEGTVEGDGEMKQN